MRSLLSGFVAGALLLAAPWPVAPRVFLLGAVGVVGVAALAAAAITIGGLVPLRPGQVDRGHWQSSGVCVGILHAIAARATWLAFVTGALVGLAWSVLAHERALELRVPLGGSGHAIPLIVRVVSDPVSVTGADPAVTAVRFLALALDGPRSAPGAPLVTGRTLRLVWYGAEAVQQGEIWRVAAVVRAPWGYANPGGFDYERWLLGQRIHGTGTIRRGVRVAVADPGFVARTRTRLAAFVADQDLRYGPILTAQLVGLTAAIPDAQWETFRVTGTIHLMVISGLHIALAASLGFAIGRWIWRLCPALLLWLDARKAGAWCGALSAGIYLALAGGGLPAVRACIMAAPVLLLLAWGRRSGAGSTMLVGLAAVLALEPLAIHQQGFWLSFGAVALLIVGFGGRRGRARAGGTLLRAQWLLTVCMAPLLVLLTGAVPLVGLLANLVAVPLVSCGVVPLSLAAGLLAGAWPAAAVVCLRVADTLFGALFLFLEYCSRIPQLHAEPAPGVVAAAAAAGFVWLVGVRRRQRLLLALCLVGVVLPRNSDVLPGEFRILGLDVGQGDAILVDTARHRLLFDTGPAFPGGFETGSAVVVPSVLATGPGVLDVLVLSHADLDHVGGASAVANSLKVGRTYASFGRPGAVECASQSWVWDGVTFRFLGAPRTDTGGAARAETRGLQLAGSAGAKPAGYAVAKPGRNDASCILLVDNGRRRALLAGDIGTAVESRLLRRLPGRIDLLFAPHHGSLTSSSRAFVRIARPRTVFVSAGRDNRYGHPHPRVVERYRAIRADVLETARAGALRWESERPLAVRGARSERAPYWRSLAPPAGDG